MPEYLVVVERVVILTVEAPSEADAKEAAIASAWTWSPGNAAGGDQGSVSVMVVSGDADVALSDSRCRIKECVNGPGEHPYRVTCLTPAEGAGHA